MNKNVLIISGYGSKILKPFGESIKEILTASFDKLAFKSTYKYLDGYQNIDIPEKDHIVIFLMTPELFQKARCYIHSKGINNQFVFWNLEPFSIRDDADNKYTRRREIIKSLAADPFIDFVWLYDKNQIAIFDYDDRYSFVPIGYHECLEPSVKIDRNVNKKIIKGKYFVFLGHATSRRLAFYRVLKSKSKIKKWRSPKIKLISHKSYKRYRNQKNIINTMAMFNMGLDLHASGVNLEHIHWHRIMMYAGAGLALISSSHLEEYGFVDGLDYIYFDSADNCARKMQKLFLDPILAKNLNERMKKKLKMHYYMPDLLRKSIEKLI